jgi:transcriptional regulator with XRE-family HTH domain
VDIARTLRAVRRSRRLNQREFADLAGLPNSTVARIESGASDPRLSTVVGLLRATGYDLVVCDQWNRLLMLDDRMDRLVDRARRRLPPHLRTAPTPLAHASGPQWWGWYRIAWWPTDGAVPDHCYWRRYEPLHYGEAPYDYSSIRVWDDAT